MPVAEQVTGAVVVKLIW